MRDYQEAFIHFCIEHNILCFGQFTLKSGRQSPYFFNAGLFNTGKALGFLGATYAKTLKHANIPFDILFGPAYKGIPLACATALAFEELYGEDMPWCFNRKEVKSHGEGGMLVGSSPEGKRVALVDDVITAGTAIGEVAPLIHDADGKLGVICIALDRQERGRQGSGSATKEVQARWNVPVISVISLDDIIFYMQDNSALKKHFPAIQDYRNEYGEKC